MKIAILPARLKSSRLPEKLLKKVAGRELILWSLEQAQKISNIDKVIIATDSTKIFDLVKNHCDVFMTDPDLPSGTDRIASVINEFPKANYILNFQADEPLLDVSYIETLIRNFPDWADVGTLVCPMKEDQFDNHNCVKAVVNNLGEVKYFSRLPIPHGSNSKWHHIGVYLYRRDALKKFVSFPPHQIEVCERLEQLRGLMNDLRYYTHIVPNHENYEVNTNEDLVRLQKKLEK